MLSLKTNCYNLNSHIKRYIEIVRGGIACKEQIQLCELVEKAFEAGDIYTNEEQLEKYLSLAKYFPFERIFEWEAFLLALHCCTYYKETGLPRFPDLFLLSGRGTGKDGFIAVVSICLASEYNGITRYDVDICANAEEQAMRPVNDILDAFEEPKHERKLKRFFYWNKEYIRNLKTKSTIKGRTNNPKSKDGMRSGIVVFNEIHQYETYKNINVFTTSLGKTPHPRRLYATTNGDVRDGVLDDKLSESLDILNGVIPDMGVLPFICRLDEEEEVHDKKKWVKANPSLLYLPSLMMETEKEYGEWKRNPQQLTAFMTKRMNLPRANKEIQVTDYENISVTNSQIPDLRGRDCVVGIDYALLSDFASVNLHFVNGDTRYDINHSWLCLKSTDLPRLKCPWKEWGHSGLITVVDNVEINPDLLAEYIHMQAANYNIKMVALDTYRHSLLSKALNAVGFDANERKNLKLIRPTDVMKIVPVVDSCFVNKNFVWGDNPVLRWAANNTKKVPATKRMQSIASKAENGEEDADVGNYIYGKIERKSRKTDPFMALVHSMTQEEILQKTQESALLDLPVIGG